MCLKFEDIILCAPEARVAQSIRVLRKEIILLEKSGRWDRVRWIAV